MKTSERGIWMTFVAVGLLWMGACQQTPAAEEKAEMETPQPVATQEPVKEPVPSESATQTVHQDISPEAFKAKIAEGGVLLDVRTPEEVSEGMLEGAMVIDFYWDQFGEALTKLEKDQPILVYCRGGGRSGKTMNLLKDMGFPQVYNLDGGITAWKEAGLPIAMPAD